MKTPYSGTKITTVHFFAGKWIWFTNSTTHGTNFRAIATKERIIKITKVLRDIGATKTQNGIWEYKRPATFFG
jgi:hypothetical protein